MDLRKAVREIADFPKAGILFYDITPILAEPKIFRKCVDDICSTLSELEFDLIIGPESRGFIFGTPVALELGKPFIPVRKAGKLPFETVKKSYSLEYGTADLEIHKDAISQGQKAVIIDDLLATGGTAAAICELVEELGGSVAALTFFIELTELNGRQALAKYNVNSILKIT